MSQNTENRVISIADLHPRTLHSILHDMVPYCLFTPDQQPDDDELRRAAIVIVTAEAEELASALCSGSLPPQKPLLILGSDSSPPPELFDRLELSHFCLDYLPLPASRELIHHRMEFLARMERLDSEHSSRHNHLDRQLKAIYSRDQLTGLLNRRQLTERLQQILQHARDNEEELSLLLLNIDYFHNLNKTLGLDFGDMVLNELAARLTENSRGKESCYRFSGEDFVILMPGTDLTTAKERATKLSRICASKPFSDGQNIKSITISMGVASLQPHQPENHEEFISMAETALFMAKAEGRNRIESYLPPGEDGYTADQSLAFLRENLNRILEKTRRSAIASLELLAKNVAGPAHRNHIGDIGRYLNLLGERLGLPEHHLQTFHNSVTLYNCFRFLLHYDLLNKPAKLTEAERKIMADLPYKLSELTDMFDYFSVEKGILESQAERYDGSGFPLGLRGNEIPLGARILNLVNAFAAMNAERPYRRKLSPEEIILELGNEAGHQFDPYLVDQLLQIIEHEGPFELDPDLVPQLRHKLHSTFGDIFQ